MIHTIVHSWFGWPNGSVLTNLIASAVVAYSVVYRKLRSMHSHIKEIHKKVHEE